jgi:RHS repeat-associated protein
LDQFGLINLNARLYDPKLAQFTGLDPLVQEPGMGQNFNRYSYCLNNPLRYSDPSGNSWLSDAFKWVKKYAWDTPWSWLNGTDKGHPGVYSGGLSQQLAKWGIPYFSVGYNSSKGFLYKVGNNSVVYPAMEAALQKQYAALSAQTQAMVAGERQQRSANMAWQDLMWMTNLGNVGKGESSEEEPSGYFEGVSVYTTTFGACKDRAAFTVPGVGIFVNPKDVNNLDMLRHEFGHVLQYRAWGTFFYYSQIVPTSIQSAFSTNSDIEHQQTWTEWSANFLSWSYFGFPNDWDRKQYPLNPSAKAYQSLRFGSPIYPVGMSESDFWHNYLLK